ncbi:hypothetical protein TPDSL_18000 [Terrisporobacter petrolearius]|uniref:hypothetical protein n=1 Tax=Terrisporobacter petrolearius TaxID=1460447 RepID=UPI003367B54D
MFELEKDLYSYLGKIYNDINNLDIMYIPYFNEDPNIAGVKFKLNDRIYADELPLDYDFKSNKVGIYYVINNINDNIYKDKVSIDVNFYCLEEDKMNMLKVIDVFDKELNGKDFKNYWIKHKNVWLIPLKEDELFHYVLSYSVNKY